MPERLLDPLAILRDLHVTAELSPDGRPVLLFDRRHDPANQRKAQAIARQWDKLLTLQLQEGGKSVRWLMAHGRIELKGGRYVVKRQG